MGQRPAATGALIFSFLLILLPGMGCERRGNPTQTPATRPARQTVASLVPAATDLIIGMGASDHLVAVSNWDADRREISTLPRVGDYRTIDWEKLAQIRPNVMIVQFAADKMPAGFKERSAEMGIELVNVHINHLDEIFETMRVLGDAMDEPEAARKAADALHAKLERVRQQVKGQPAVRTLLTRSESSLASVGGGNYLDELLAIAGGKNVLEGGENSYPTIDREQLLKLNPDVIIQLLPGASKQVVDQASQSLRGMDVSAVKAGRVYALTQPYLLLPGYSVGEVAEEFAKILHHEEKRNGAS